MEDDGAQALHVSLHKACASGDVEALEALLAATKPPEQSLINSTLAESIRNIRMNVLQLLLGSFPGTVISEPTVRAALASGNTAILTSWTLS